MQVVPYNGNNPQKKMFANWQLFLIHEKMFANGDNPSQIYSFLIQLPISPLTTPIFPMKVATVEVLQSSMHQCSSYSGHTHLQLLNQVILPKHFNTGKGRPSSLGKKKTLKLNIQLKHMIIPLKL